MGSFKEKIFDGGNDKYMIGWCLQIPRSGSVQAIKIISNHTKPNNMKLQDDIEGSFV